MCVSFYYFFPPLGRNCHSLLSRFYGSVRTKKSMNGVYKINIDCSFIRGMVENYCTLGKTQPQAYYSPRPYGPRWIVGQGWVSPRDNNFPLFHSWAVNICILFPWLSKKLSQLPNLELDSLLSRFYGSVRTKNLWMGCIKQILTALLFGEWWKIIVPSVKFNLGLLFTEALH